MSESSDKFTLDAVITVMRNSFYDGAQYLYTEHFTSCLPFPAKEVMNEAAKRFQYPRELRTVTINGNKYRVRDGNIEIQTGASNAREWDRAVAITPEYVKTLADLIDHPYEVSK